MTPGSGTGIGGSPVNGGSMSYPGKLVYSIKVGKCKTMKEIVLLLVLNPAVPFGPNDFTPRSSCPSGSGDIENYGNAQQVRNCKLSGMPDIYQGKLFSLVFVIIVGVLNIKSHLKDPHTFAGKSSSS